jgi:hypothetical protein
VVAFEANIAILAGCDTITTFPSTLFCVGQEKKAISYRDTHLNKVTRITNAITNPFWNTYRTIGVIEDAVGAKIAIVTGAAITTIPTALRRVVLAITNTITNQCWNGYITVGIIEVALGAEIAIFSTV